MLKYTPRESRTERKAKDFFVSCLDYKREEVEKIPIADVVRVFISICGIERIIQREARDQYFGKASRIL